MDKNFRRQMERQIDLLQRRKLCREIRMTGVVPLPKNGFRHWSDNGREWRESVLQSSALERLLIVKEDRPFYTIFRKEDRKATTPTGGTINCPFCGSNFVPDENHCCSFCGYSLQVDNAKWVVQTKDQRKTTCGGENAWNEKTLK